MSTVFVSHAPHPSDRHSTTKAVHYFRTALKQEAQGAARVDRADQIDDHPGLPGPY